jgi:hypothetical protein
MCIFSSLITDQIDDIKSCIQKHFDPLDKRVDYNPSLLKEEHSEIQDQSRCMPELAHIKS